MSDEDVETVEAEVAEGSGGWSGLVVATSMLLGAVIVVGGLAAIATPKFGAARKRSSIRACYANQKTIAGAVEMYNLDFKTTVTDLQGVAPQLVRKGYLQTIPSDPGQGEGSFRNYRLTGESGNGISCEVHGPIQAPQ